MADSQKKLALDALAAALEASEAIQTVVIVNDRLDLDLKFSEDLPLAQIIPSEEGVSYQTSRVAMFAPGAEVTVFFVGEDEEYETRQALRKAVLDAIGEDPTLGGTCADCRVRIIVSRGEFPLFEEVFGLEIIFERHIADA